MKNIKYILVIGLCFLLTGCAKDFKGTWCLYTDTPSSLVVLNKDIIDNDLNTIKNFIETDITDLKTYDVIDSIEDSNQMIIIYYLNKDNINKYQDVLSTLNGVDSVTEKELNTPVEELDITSDSYTYGTQLDTVYASNNTGTYKINNNTLTLDTDTLFYYKDSYLCYDKSCSKFLVKSNGSTCDNN